MKEALFEIKNLAQIGLEKNIISKDVDNKEIFLNILLKTELLLSKLDEKKSQIYKNKHSGYENSIRTYTRHDEDVKSDMYLIAYCFSNYEHTSLFPALSQDNAFIVAAEKLNVKKNTLKNTRDWFDGHNDNHRSGWWQQPLPEDMQRFKDVYDKKEREDILKEARTVLDIEDITKNYDSNFGQTLKVKQFGGRFTSKQDVEKFINIVLERSSNVVKDLIEQCSQKTFNACFPMFSTINIKSVDELASELVKYDPRLSSNSPFSLWIRARFIKEIFQQNLQNEALKN